ncbi:MAG: hypothetical protein LM601_00360 [Candidatus Verstraetearchaeota archaeon]|jgi:hypothetical protein|nr:hypothetical protein [Candidatus Verstraetearchaeota archaeon]
MRNVISNSILNFGLIFSTLLLLMSMGSFYFNIINNDRVYYSFIYGVRESIVYGVETCRNLGLNSSICIKLSVPTRFIGFRVSIFKNSLIFYCDRGEFKLDLPNLIDVCYVDSSVNLSREFMFLCISNVNGKINVRLQPF